MYICIIYIYRIKKAHTGKDKLILVAPGDIFRSFDVKRLVCARNQSYIIYLYYVFYYTPVTIIYYSKCLFLLLFLLLFLITFCKKNVRHVHQLY